MDFLGKHYASQNYNANQTLATPTNIPKSQRGENGD